eukprot:gene27580-33312_t
MGSGSSISSNSHGSEEVYGAAINKSIPTIPLKADLSTDFALVKTVFDLFDGWYLANAVEVKNHQSVEPPKSKSRAPPDNKESKKHYHSAVDSLTAIDSMLFVRLLCQEVNDLVGPSSCDEDCAPLQTESICTESIRELFTRFHGSVKLLLENMSKWESSKKFNRADFSPSAITVDIEELNTRVNRMRQHARAELSDHFLFKAVVILFLLSVEPCFAVFTRLSAHPMLIESLLSAPKHFPDILAGLLHLLDKLLYASGVWQSRGPYGVSLTFLLNFLKEHNAAIEGKTTGEVVANIIVPATAESKLSYLEAHLLNKHPHLYGDLTKRGHEFHMDKDNPVVASTLLHANDAYHSYEGWRRRDGSFVSHAWNMPFNRMVAIVVNKLTERFTSMFVTPERAEISDSCFLWIDVFCKNQHIPAPAMDEFETAMRASGSVIFCIWPTPPLIPISLSRVWCLFEAWTCLKLGASLSMSLPLGGLSDYQEWKAVLDVNVSNATATQKSDIELILSLISKDIGIDEFNKALDRAIKAGIEAQIMASQNYPSCFDGQGAVLMADGSYKLVQEVQKGDLVRTFDPQTGLSSVDSEVELVTVDNVAGQDVGMCEYHGLMLTPEHPVFTQIGQDKQQSKWMLPKDFLPIVKVELNKIYNFELRRGHTVKINGVVVLTLGNDLSLGLHAENEELYGRGWRENPKRKKYI